jgi:NhaA family Na+:H+ antiporter
MEAALRLVVRFIHQEATSGILLLGCAVAALAWANSPWGASYFTLWQTPIAFRVGDFLLEKPLLLWINEGLMALFFFVIGLEIKRELLVGALSSPRRALLPLAAAVGGMLVPALIYTVLNAGTPTVRGWGIPMATDIAFSLGVLALLGTRAPLSLKVFLTALAIVDDMGAVLVIALFYSEPLAWSYLGIGAGLLLVSALMGALGVRQPLVYALLGVALWLAFLKSGVHATVAGVLLAMTIPARTRIDLRSFTSLGRQILGQFERASAFPSTHVMNSQQQAAVQALELACRDVESPLQRLERALHPWVAFFVMPLFALANAGVVLDAQALRAELHPVSLGIVLGLLVGKPLGITLFAWLAVRLKLAVLPADLVWRHIVGVGLLGGIGFTMSLFIAQLAFPALEGEWLSLAKVGILTGSLLAGLGGWLVLRGVPMVPR